MSITRWNVAGSTRHHRAVAGDPSVGHDHVEPAEARGRLRQRVLHRREVADVAEHGEHSSPSSSASSPQRRRVQVGETSLAPWACTARAVSAPMPRPLR